MATTRRSHRKLRYSLPSPPSDCEELDFSTTTTPGPSSDRCWRADTDLCRSLDLATLNDTLDLATIQKEAFIYLDRSSCDTPSSGGSSTVYPSPPSPTVSCLPSNTSYKVVDAGGVLDSPLAMRDVAKANMLPPSPPPTIPTTTSTLPESQLTAVALPPSPESDSGAKCLCEDQSENATASTSEDDDVDSSLLQPLSPEWSTQISNLSPPTLGGDDGTLSPSSTSLTFGRSPCHSRRTSSSSPESPTVEEGAAASSSPSSAPSALDLPFPPTAAVEGSSSPTASDDAESLPDMLDFPFGEEEEEEGEDVWGSTPPITQSTEWRSWDRYHHEDPETTSTAFHRQIPASSAGSIVTPPPSPPSEEGAYGHGRKKAPRSIFIPSIDDEDDEEVVPFDDRFYLPSSSFDDDNDDHDQWRPHSPSLRSFPSLLSSPPGSYDPLPSSPSPSRRSLSSLPSMTDSESSPSGFFASPPSSPSMLISLPGADADDDLLPSFDFDDEDPIEPLPTLSPAPGLMLISDEDPSAEAPEEADREEDDAELEIPIPPTIDPTLRPELTALIILRKRSLSLERTARQIESTPELPFAQRAEARRQRKREKNRGKEIGCLLKLKLGKEGSAAVLEDTKSSSSSSRKKNNKEKEQQKREKEKEKEGSKKVITTSATSMPRLVAQMVLRRHDTNRPLAARERPTSAEVHATHHNYVRSSLSRPVLATTTTTGAVDGDENCAV